MRTFLPLFLGFIALRLGSFAAYFFFPEIHYTLSTILSGIFLVLLLFLYKKNPLFGLFAVFTEILIGGAGHYLEFFGVSLRTCFIVLYLCLFALFERKKIQIKNIPRPLMISGGILGASLVIAAAIGIVNGHNTAYVIADIIPFLTLGLLFPLLAHWKTIHAAYIKVLSAVFVLGNTLFSLLTLALFSFGIAHLQDPYYKWFRDIAMGKITDMGTGFFRIVLPEHLLFIPILLIIPYFFIHKTQKKWLRAVQIMSIFVIITNFSRMYLLALCFSLIFLFSKKYYKKWLKESLVFLYLLALIFAFTHTLSSKGQSFGFELFGDRAKSIVVPDSELSSATRMTLLPVILKKIQTSPMVGSGLGSSIIFTDPITNTPKETRQFDWGYLELVTELGVVGFFSYLFSLSFLLSLTFRKRILLGMAPAIALLAIAITTPILEHTIGVFLITIFAAATMPDVTSSKTQ